MKRLAALAVSMYAALAGLAAQGPAAPAFDVASVKPNQSGEAESAAFVQPGGRYTATNVTVRFLVKSAYGLHDDQVVGGPAWMNSDRFDIAARADNYTTASGFRDAARLMLRPLLADRFKLVLASDRRELPVYALMLARAGRLGPQLRRFDAADCDAGRKVLAPVAGALEPGAELPCGAEIYRPGHLAARGLELSLFALNVSRYTDHVVVDRTGLTGKFDWELQWIPDDAERDAATPPAGPSLPSALEEQTGFRLRGQRALVDVRVVERLERPAPD